MMKKGVKYLAALVGVCLLTAGCGSGSSGSAAPTAAAMPESLTDGTYEGRSADHEADEDGNGGGYGEVELVIADGAISECTFTMYELDGTLKDDSYGADLSKENRLKAQKAVQSAPKYAQSLVENGSPDKVDVISGATISYEEFQEALEDALTKAAG